MESGGRLSVRRRTMALVIGSRSQRGRAASRGRAHGLLVLLVLVLAGVVAGRAVVLLLGAPGPAAPGAPAVPAVHAPAVPTAVAEVRRTSPSAREQRRAARVLLGEGADRATAYARGDPAALRRLYVPGSRAGRMDLRVLRAYAERGLVVRGMRMQLLSLRVLVAGARSLELAVTDRRVGGHAVGRPAGPAVTVALPQDAPTTRVLVLQRAGDRWQVASVTDA